MASLTIRGLDEAIKTKLRLQAAQHGWSMEQEVRDILRLAVSAPEQEKPFLERMRQHFADVEIDNLPIPPRQPQRTPPSFED